jgi:putative oxygen-independent coproporphyrinogen III oxidase
MNLPARNEATIQFEQLPELSLYLHLPWCIRKCPYCDFNSHESRGEIPQEQYINALIADLEASLPMVWGRPVVSVFMGGGTPSLFSPDAIARLLSEIRARIKLLPGAEITLEANPGTFEIERFEGFAKAGVNRLSIGVQSFNDEQLSLLGRVHDRHQALQAAAHAFRIFPRVNLDLMFGLPRQTLQDLERELDTALNTGVRHLSCYQLTMEPGTRFAIKPPLGLPHDDLLADMQSLVVEKLASAGLQRYEISAFAVPGHECQHNLNYWTFGDYLGLGAGAHGKISFADRIGRTQKLKNPGAYMEWIATGASPPRDDDKSAPRDDDSLDRHREHAEGGRGGPVAIQLEELPFEFMLNALRLTQGVPVGRWCQTTGMAIADHPFLLERIGQAQALGLLEGSPGRFKATPRGLELLNDLQAIFL